jgi:hypothetical protein
LSFSQLAEHLRAKYRLSTTPGTLCRYVKQLSPDLAPRGATPQEEETVDMAMLFAELLAEVRGRGEEQRRALEHQAGQIRVLMEMVAEIQAVPDEPPPAIVPYIVRRIWIRAFLLSLSIIAPIAIIVASIAV